MTASVVNVDGLSSDVVLKHSASASASALFANVDHWPSKLTTPRLGDQF